jgi:hypothetical protein
MYVDRRGPESTLPLRFDSRRLRRWNEAIARHDREELLAVWRASGIDDAGNVAKVLRTDIGCQGDERACISFMRIAEPVHGPFGRAHPVARMQVARNVVDRIAQRSLEHVDTLFVVRMAVWRRDIRPWWNGQFEYAHAFVGSPVYQILNFKLTNLHYVCWAHVQLLG